MKCSDLASFKKALCNSSHLCLVVAKEADEAIEAVLKQWKAPVVSLDPDTLTPKRFLQEVETLPFLSKHLYLHVPHLERLKSDDLDVFIEYAKSPSKWVSLLLSASSLPPQSKLVKAFEQNGLALRLAETKAWEKERHSASWLMEMAKEGGAEIEPSAATQLVHTIGTERALLRQELEKLICYAAGGRITEKAISALCEPVSRETLFQLTDAILQRQTRQAWLMGRSLVEEGGSLFPLIAGLRTQMRSGIQILSLYRDGGALAVTESFPYLKGGLLEKKMRLLQGYGLESLRDAVSQLFETELLAKNSATDPLLLLDILLVRLTYAFTAAKSIGATKGN